MRLKKIDESACSHYIGRLRMNKYENNYKLFCEHCGKEFDLSENYDIKDYNFILEKLKDALEYIEFSGYNDD